MGERHNSGLKKLLEVHLTFFFGLVSLLNLKKIAQKMGKTHQLFETTKKKKKTLVGGALPLDSG